MATSIGSARRGLTETMVLLMEHVQASREEQWAGLAGPIQDHADRASDNTSKVAQLLNRDLVLLTFAPYNSAQLERFATLRHSILRLYL